MACEVSRMHEEDLGLAQKLPSVEKEGEISESSTQKFYAVRRCKNLLKPAIFLAWEDCCPFLISEEFDDDSDSDDEGGKKGAEYKTFDAMLDACTYILKITSGNEPQHRSLVEAASALPPTQNAATAPQQGQSENEPELLSLVEAASTLEHAQATATPQKQLANNTLPSENEQEHSQLVEKDSNVDMSTTAATMPQPEGPLPVAQSPAKRKRAPRSSTKSKETAKVSSKAAKRRRPAKETLYDILWNKRIEELKAFKAVHGHCEIPRTLEENPSLCNWAKTQRTQHRRLREGRESRIAPERIRQLTSLGFNFHPAEESKHSIKWDKKMEELKAFKAVHGHCNVPARYDENQGLAIWVTTQRTQHRLLREGKNNIGITPERIRELTSVGFKWTVAKTEILKFKDRLEQLIAYREKHGHCNVPQYTKDKSIPQGLGSFVMECRRMYKNHLAMMYASSSTAKPKNCKRIITQEEIDQLEAVGFQWQLRNRGQQTQIENEPLGRI